MRKGSRRRGCDIDGLRGCIWNIRVGLAASEFCKECTVFGLKEPEMHGAIVER